MAESPQWLADRGDHKGAVEVLHSHHGTGVGSNQGLLLGFSILFASLETGVSWVVACAPLLGAVSPAVIRWGTTGRDVDTKALTRQP